MSGNIEKMSMSRVLAMDGAWTLGQRAQSVDLCMLKEDSRTLRRLGLDAVSKS